MIESKSCLPYLLFATLVRLLVNRKHSLFLELCDIVFALSVGPTCFRLIIDVLVLPRPQLGHPRCILLVYGNCNQLCITGNFVVVVGLFKTRDSLGHFIHVLD